MGDLEPPTYNEAIEFLNSEAFDDAAKTKFNALSGKVQKLVIVQGPLESAVASQNPSAELFYRIRRCTELASGNWICEACFFLNTKESPDSCIRCSAIRHRQI